MNVGTVIGGFRIERLIGSGELGDVYEATQLSLGRTVALRLIGGESLADPEASARFQEQQRLAASVHHPNIVPTYEAGEWNGGRFVATRYIRGRTLADLLAARSLSRERVRALLEPVEGALAAVHRAGLVHGRVTPQNVLVDASGSAQLADLGLGRRGSAEADRDAFAALLRSGDRHARRSGLRRVAGVALGALALAGVAAAVLGLIGGVADGGVDRDPPPPVMAGTVPLGSDLAAGPAPGIGCAEEPGPNTPACTLSQAAIGGRLVTAREAGAIRGWAVRGASGDLTLQVIGRRRGRVFMRGFSQVERVPDGGPHEFETDLRVEPGDRIGLLLAPGAVIGARAGPAGTSALRWEGALEYTPHAQSAITIERELMLRADVEPGARPELPQITGREAQSAPAGSVLGGQVIELPGSGAVRVELVRVEGGIAIDSFRGRRRLARVAIPDVLPGGRLLGLEGGCGFRRGFCLRWLNEGEPLPVIHAYRLARRGSLFRLIG